VTILTWVLVLYFYEQNGHMHMLRPGQTFDSRAECEANAPQVRNYIQLRPGERSFAVKCQVGR
jgi:hypothetical protein